MVPEFHRSDSDATGPSGQGTPPFTWRSPHVHTWSHDSPVEYFPNIYHVSSFQNGSLARRNFACEALDGGALLPFDPLCILLGLPQSFLTCGCVFSLLYSGMRWNTLRSSLSNANRKHDIMEKPRRGRRLYEFFITGFTRATRWWLWKRFWFKGSGKES